jgi:hypothetical protein
MPATMTQAQANLEFSSMCMTVKARLKKLDYLQDGAIEYARELQAFLAELEAEGPCSDIPPGTDPNAFACERPPVRDRGYEFLHGDDGKAKWTPLKRVIPIPETPGPHQTISAG